MSIAAVRLQIYAAKVKSYNRSVLQYHRDTDQLRVWAWPSNSTLTQGRVKPSDLQDYRQSHRMLGPCCLCPMQDATQPDFVEAAMYMITVGLLSGEYVASCARNRCGYFVFMERLYDKIGVPIALYDRRGPGERVPPEVKRIEHNVLENVRGRLRPLKRTFAMIDINAHEPGRTPPIARRAAPVRFMNRRSVSKLLQLLDARA